jgi:diacylglycerol kinase
MPRSWRDKFRSAFHGIWIAITNERSFAIHLPMAAAVVITAALLRVSMVEACLLALCIAIVLTAEIFNTSIEFLTREITRDQRPGIAAALDMASGAVLTLSLAAAGVGSLIFITRAALLFGWWK